MSRRLGKREQILVAIAKQARGECLTLKETGLLLNVSMQAVHLVEQRAIRKLRAELMPLWRELQTRGEVRDAA